MGDDLISRQVAIDALEKKKDKKSQGDIGSFYNKIIQNDIDTLMLLPSADRPQGEWIHAHVGTIAEGDYCSNCGKVGYGSKFCPNCGAKMDGERGE